MLVSPAIQAAFTAAQNVVFLTGAGVSTPSGIPDYRSKNGLYQGLSLPPEVLLSRATLAKAPAAQYAFIMDHMAYPDAQPNGIHAGMAAWTRAGRARIITQNVDGLDAKAGADPTRLIEYHGNLYDIIDTVTGDHVGWDAYAAGMQTAAGHLLRPNITLYGEVPHRTAEAAAWVAAADLVCIVGTSFVVYPFAGLLDYAPAGIPIYAVNLAPLDRADARVQQVVGDAQDFFRELQLD
jgi:NAD-dependent deacetylase